MDLTTVDLAKINNKLENLGNLGVPVSTSQETNSYGTMYAVTKVYHLYDDLYISITRNTDSYGDDERITGFQFVIPTKRTFTDFEPVR